MSDPLRDELEHILGVLIDVRQEANERADHELSGDLRWMIEKLAYRVALMRRLERHLIDGDANMQLQHPELPF